MTTRTQTKMIPRVETVYIAEDGTEFTDSSVCKAYENELKRKQAMKGIECIETCEELRSVHNFDGGLYYDEDCKSCWYHPKNEEEIEKLNNMYCPVGYKDFTASMIDKWICVEVDCDDDMFSVSTLDEAIAYASDILSKLGYNMTVTKRGAEDEV